MNKRILKNLHLIISLLIVIPAALIYGIDPTKNLPLLFDFSVNSVDLKNIFRAIMTLYLAISAVWILGILKPKFWGIATIVNIIFMGGLGLGRLISLLLDGMPSALFFYGMMGEFVLAVFGIIQLQMNKKHID